MKLSRKVLLFFVLGSITLSISAGENPLASKKLIQALVEEISGETAFNYTVMISRYDRIQASEGWREAALMIQDELKKIGYQDAAIEGWPSNGSRYYYTYQTPIGWRAREAELLMVSPRKERLCSYQEIPLTLVKHSHSADAEAELVDVGIGIGEDSYQGKDVQGKIVLATAYTGDVMREAVLKRGALGVITWFPPEERPGYPNMIRYTAIWPRWEEREKIGFGFNVSKAQGWMLKNMLDEGEKIVLKAFVDAEHYDSKIEVLTASLPGREDSEKEVMIIGHLCHPLPSANDNASGSGGMLEMARALMNLVERGLIERPKRTVRFLWVPEFYGTVPYIKEHLERTRNTLSVINCDMIGEDLHLTGGTFNITCTPDSVPSYLNDVVVNFTRLADSLKLQSTSGSKHPFAYRVLPFGGGSDHYIFNDGALKVPSVMLGHDDIFHHTNLDTPDKVDASELRRVCFVALGSSYYLANASESEAKDMSQLIARNGMARLSADYYDSLYKLRNVQDPNALNKEFRQVLNVIEHAAAREIKSTLSTSVFSFDPQVKKDIQESTQHLKVLSAAFLEEAEKIYEKLCVEYGIKPLPVILTSEEEELNRVIPLRDKDFVCPLQRGYIQEQLGSEELNQISLRSLVAFEALNFADGQRSIFDITQAVSAEYGQVNIQEVYDFFKILERASLVTFIKIPSER